MREFKDIYIQNPRRTNVKRCKVQYILIPICVLFHVLAITSLCSFLRYNNPNQFKYTEKEKQMIEDVIAYRKKLTFHTINQVDLSTNDFPIIYRTVQNKTVPTYAIRAEIKLMKLRNWYVPKRHKSFKHGTLLFGRLDSSQFMLANKKGKQFAHVKNVDNLKYYDGKISMCASLQVQTRIGLYRIKMVNNCMFLRDLLHRWGSSSREFVGKFPRDRPIESEGATDFGIFWHREQPSHFAAVYMKDTETLHSVPLKNVIATPSAGSRGRRINIMGEYFNGEKIWIHDKPYKFIVEQTLKFHKESNRRYPFSMLIPEENNENTSEDFKNGKLDNSLFMEGAYFKYNIKEKECYIANTYSYHKLSVADTQIFFDGEGIKIINNMYINGNLDVLYFQIKKYGLLIARDAELCGLKVVNMTSQE